VKFSNKLNVLALLWTGKSPCVILIMDMTERELFREISTLSPAQRESVHSFIYLLKHPNYLQTLPKKVKVEPFVNEREALDFVNYYSGRMLNETG
jgi:hypothetical protein